MHVAPLAHEFPDTSGDAWADDAARFGDVHAHPPYFARGEVRVVAVESVARARACIAGACQGKCSITRTPRATAARPRARGAMGSGVGLTQLS